MKLFKKITEKKNLKEEDHVNVKNDIILCIVVRWNESKCFQSSLIYNLEDIYFISDGVKCQP